MKQLWLVFFLVGVITFFWLSPKTAMAAPIPCLGGSTNSCPNRTTDQCKNIPSPPFVVCADASGRIYGIDPGAGTAPQEWDKDLCYTVKTVDGEEVKVATLQGFGCIFRNILRLAVPLLGLALFVLLLVGGFQYMTAGGDPKQTQKAAGTITTAVIGIVVVIGAWFIFQILNALTGINLLKIVIPG